MIDLNDVARNVSRMLQDCANAEDESRRVALGAEAVATATMAVLMELQEIHKTIRSLKNA